MFRDEGIAFVYIYKEPVNIDELTLQKEEVESAERFDLKETYRECQYHWDKFCVPIGGLEVVRKYLRENKS